MKFRNFCICIDIRKAILNNLDASKLSRNLFRRFESRFFGQICFPQIFANFENSIDSLFFGNYWPLLVDNKIWPEDDQKT